MSVIDVRQVGAFRRFRTARDVAAAKVSENRADRFSAHRAFPELDRDISRHHIVDFPQCTEDAAESALEAIAGKAAHVAEQLSADANHARIQEEQWLMR